MTYSHRAASDLLTELQDGTLSASELMDSTLARIAEANPKVNAIVALRERADLMAEAGAKDASDARGPLHGLPIAVKDLAMVEGLVSTSGSPLFRNHIPDSDELIAARMRAAGAILIGKTNVPEFGLGSHTFNPVYGITRNPYDAAFTCGGSSGGAAVSLATGMTALADGSDMMGSLRNPAAWNNVYGLRPTWGLVPSESEGEIFLHQMSTLGPMARSPQDIAVLLDVIAGPDAAQPHGVVQAPAAPVDAAELSGKRIGWLGDWGGAFPLDDGILSLCEAAVDVLGDLGAEVVPIAPPFSADAMWESWIALRSWQVGMGLAPLLAEGRAELKATAIWEVERGLAMRATEVHKASEIRSDWFRAAAQLFETYDALVLPCTQVWPFDVDTEYPIEIAGVAMDTYHRWMQAMIPVSLIGLPALAMPAGFGVNGLPCGIQLFGRRGSDAALLSMGAAYDAATRWVQTRPPPI